METPTILGYEVNRQTLTPIRRTVQPAKVASVALPQQLHFVDMPPDPAPNNRILSELQSLSSGTIASLIKKTEYESIDATQTALVYYYLYNYNPAWNSWVDVWEAFCAAH